MTKKLSYSRKRNRRKKSYRKNYKRSNYKRKTKIKYTKRRKRRRSARGSNLSSRRSINLSLRLKGGAMQEDDMDPDLAQALKNSINDQGRKDADDPDLVLALKNSIKDHPDLVQAFKNSIKDKGRKDEDDPDLVQALILSLQEDLAVAQEEHAVAKQRAEEPFIEDDHEAETTNQAANRIAEELRLRISTMERRIEELEHRRDAAAGELQADAKRPLPRGEIGEAGLQPALSNLPSDVVGIVGEEVLRLHEVPFLEQIKNALTTITDSEWYYDSLSIGSQHCIGNTMFFYQCYLDQLIEALPKLNLQKDKFFLIFSAGHAYIIYDEDGQIEDYINISPNDKVDDQPDHNENPENWEKRIIIDKSQNFIGYVKDGFKPIETWDGGSELLFYDGITRGKFSSFPEGRTMDCSKPFDCKR